MPHFEVAVQGCSASKGLATAFMGAGEVDTVRVVVTSGMSRVLMLRGFVITMSMTGRRVGIRRDLVGKIIIISEFAVPVPILVDVRGCRRHERRGEKKTHVILLNVFEKNR